MKSTKKRGGRGVALKGLELVFHALMVVLPTWHLELIGSLRHDAQVGEALWRSGLMLAALSSVLWGGAWYTLVRLKRRRRHVRRLALARAPRGSVMTEFIVILPVFLLLMFGMVQLAINLIGGLLHRVASYQAARTAWVWEGEMSGSRHAVDNTIIEDRVRTAVALVMTPVAPGSMGDWSLLTGGSDRGPAQTRVAGLMANRFLPFGSDYVPDDVYSFATSEFVGAAFAAQGRHSMTAALDDQLMVVRAILKFVHAYEAVDAVAVEVGPEIKVTYTYSHQQAMPFVGRVFGERRSWLGGGELVGGRPGYFTTWNAERSLPRQSCNQDGECPANPARP